MSSFDISPQRSVARTMVRLAILGTGLALSMILFVYALEFYMLQGGTRDAAVHALKQAHEAFSAQQGLTTPTWLEKVSESTLFYGQVARIVWMSWLFPIAGFLLTALVLVLLDRRRDVQVLSQTATLYYDKLAEERRARKQAQEAMVQVQSHLEQVHEHLSEGFMEVDGRERLMLANRRAVLMFSTWGGRLLRPDDVTGRQMADILPGYVTSGFALAVEDALSKGSQIERELFLAPLNVWLYVRLYPAATGVYVYFRDTSLEKTTGDSVKATDSLLRLLMGGAPAAVAVVDPRWNYLYATPKWIKQFKLEQEPERVGGLLTDKNHRQLLPQFPGKWEELDRRLEKQETVRGIEDLFSIAGAEEWITWEVRPWHDADSRLLGYVIFASMVTELKSLKDKQGALKEREQQLAYQDTLTSLPNRQLFYDRLGMALAQAYRQMNQAALMFLDLDGFKAVNDSLGHDAGDLLLKEVAARLQTCVRNSDTVARLGGDEFTVILHVIQDEESVRKVAEKIIAAIGKPYALAGQEVKVGTSIGIAVYPADGTTVTDLIKQADNAMYVSKRNGKNRATFVSGAVVTAPSERRASKKEENVSEVSEGAQPEEKEKLQEAET